MRPSIGLPSFKQEPRSLIHTPARLSATAAEEDHRSWLSPDNCFHPMVLCRYHTAGKNGAADKMRSTSRPIRRTRCLPLTSALLTVAATPAVWSGHNTCFYLGREPIIRVSRRTSALARISDPSRTSGLLKRQQPSRRGSSATASRESS
jgi:hypothetical protein